MNNIKLKFEFSIESEIKRVNNTLAKIEGFEISADNAMSWKISDTKTILLKPE